MICYHFMPKMIENGFIYNEKEYELLTDFFSTAQSDVIYKNENYGLSYMLLDKTPPFTLKVHSQRANIFLLRKHFLNLEWLHLFCFLSFLLACQDQALRLLLFLN